MQTTELMTLEQFKEACLVLFNGAHGFKDNTGQSPGVRTTCYSANISVKGLKCTLHMSYPVAGHPGVNLFTKPNLGKSITNQDGALEQLKRFAAMLNE